MGGSNVGAIYLVRHGETTWNATGRFQGRLDSPLTDRGIAQARAIGHLLAPIAADVEAIHASPLGRVRQTVEIIAETAVAAVRYDARLTEVSLGSWDGLTQLDIDAQWPGRLDETTPYDWFFRAPDGEGYAAAAERAQSWLDTLRGDVIAVSHGLIGRIIRGAYAGLAMEETLALPVPQDVVWRLAHGRIDALSACA